MKNVQIPYELFVDLVLYHLNGEDDFDEDIRRGLEQKLGHAEPPTLFAVQNSLY